MPPCGKLMFQDTALTQRICSDVHKGGNDSMRSLIFRDIAGRLNARIKVAVVCTVSVCVIFEPVHDPPCSALNPCKGTLVEPVTNCRRRPLLSSLKASTACQNHRTTLLSLVQCFRRVLVFQSARSIFPSPPMINWKRGRRIKKKHRWPLQTFILF